MESRKFKIQDVLDILCTSDCQALLVAPTLDEAYTILENIFEELDEYCVVNKDVVLQKYHHLVYCKHTAHSLDCLGLIMCVDPLNADRFLKLDAATHFVISKDLGWAHDVLCKEKLEKAVWLIY